MAISEIKSSGDVQRKFLACAVDVSDEPGTEDFIVMGYKLESSALEFNPEETGIVDINGRSWGGISKLQLKQSFEPYKMTSGDHGKLGAKLLQYVRDGELSKFSEFKCVIIYGFLGESGSGVYPSDKYDACTIIPSSLGGDAWAEMPITVSFGGNLTKGNSDGLVDKIVFTPEV